MAIPDPFLNSLSNDSRSEISRNGLLFSPFHLQALLAYGIQQKPGPHREHWLQNFPDSVAVWGLQVVTSSKVPKPLIARDFQLRGMILVAKRPHWRLMWLSHGHQTLHPSSHSLPLSLLTRDPRRTTEHSLETTWCPQHLPPHLLNTSQEGYLRAAENETTFPHNSLLLKIRTGFEHYVLR